MNKRFFYIFLILMMLCSSLLLICCKKNIEEIKEAKPIVRFSQESGFFEDEFDLVITANEGTIYYTVDSSTPDSSSSRYTEPIHIRDISQNANTWSMREDVSTGFLTERISQTVYTAPGYKAPDYPVDKCMVVRAVAINEKGVASQAKTGVYFFEYEEKNGYDVNIVSIVTDPENLFDYNRGIYVTGKTFDDYLRGGSTVPYWWWWNANYRNSGDAWERKANIQFFNSEKECLTSKNIGFRVQGGGSRGMLPRSFNLYARDEYDGESKFGYDFFSNGFNPQRMTLFAGGDQNLSKLNDYLIASLVKNRNFSLMEFEPYVLFLDGEYWGFYWLTEKYDEEYFAFHFGIDEDNLIMIKNGEIEEGNSRDLKCFTSMKDYITSHDMAVELNYSHACKLIDINSYIDYFAAEIYIARYNDWPGGNYALWRTRDIRDDKYSDGKWRWLLFDVNSGSMSYDITTADTLSWVISKDSVFASLWKNREFQSKFADTILNMADNDFLPETVDSFIAGYKTKMTPILLNEYKRFYGAENDKINSLNNALDNVKLFFDGRREYIISEFTKYQSN